MVGSKVAGAATLSCAEPGHLYGALCPCELPTRRVTVSRLTRRGCALTVPPPNPTMSETGKVSRPRMDELLAHLPHRELSNPHNPP
jgi:hypothetical protein